MTKKNLTSLEDYQALAEYVAEEGSLSVAVECFVGCLAKGDHELAVNILLQIAQHMGKSGSPFTTIKDMYVQNKKPNEVH